jgi:RNA polymerase sigma-70 factor (ECF subfamily)
MNRRQHDEILNDWLSRHGKLLAKVARSFSVSTHDKEDLIQEIAFQIWTSIPNYKPEVAETTWIYRVAFYTAINWSRKEKSRRKRLNAYRMQISEADSKQTPPDPRLEWLYQRISELGYTDRALVLLLFDEFSYREMSETLGISESNVGVRINRIKKKLVEQLEEIKHNELR